MEEKKWPQEAIEYRNSFKILDTAKQETKELKLPSFGRLPTVTTPALNSTQIRPVLLAPIFYFHRISLENLLVSVV